MARFDVYRNPSGSKSHPYVVDVQHELLEALPTRVVIPLVRADLLGGPPVLRLNPTCTLERTKLVVLTQQLGAVRASGLTRRVGSLAARSAEVLEAIDVLGGGL